MIAYWFMFLLPAAAVAMRGDYSASRLKQFWVAVVALFVLLIGLRHRVGGDWWAYSQHFLRTSTESFREAIAHSDPGYFVLNWWVAKMGGDIYHVNLICGLIVMIGVGYFARKQPLPWVGLLVAVPYLLVVVAMGYTRQSAALGFAMLGLACLGEDRLKLFVGFVLLGALFHKSSLLLLPIAALASSKNKVITAIWVGVAGAMATKLLLLDTADRLWENYVEAQYSSSGGLIRVMMNAVPSVLLILFKDRLFLTDQQKRLWLWLSILALICIPLVTVSSTAVDRVALYFIPIQIFVFSRLPLLGKNLEMVHRLSLAIVAYYALVLFVWLNFGSFSHAWLPYSNHLWHTETIEFGPQAAGLL